MCTRSQGRSRRELAECLVRVSVWEEGDGRAERVCCSETEVGAVIACFAWLRLPTVSGLLDAEAVLLASSSTSISLAESQSNHGATGSSAAKSLLK
jgi:hypothetical protein